MKQLHAVLKANFNEHNKFAHGVITNIICYEN